MLAKRVALDSQSLLDADSSDYDVFISYRREEAGPAARRLHDELTGDYRVFLDAVVVEGGDHIEVALMKLSEMNRDTRTVLLSATLPNVDEICGWVSTSTLTKRASFSS